MDQGELIQKLTESGITKLTPATRLGTYCTTMRSSLLAKQVHNRSSADWKKAQFVIVDNDQNSDPLQSCLDGWKSLAEDNQYLLICEGNQWLFFNNRGEKPIKSLEEMLESKKKINKKNRVASNNLLWSPWNREVT